PIKGKDLDVLAELLEHSKHLVTYSQFIIKVWNDKDQIDDSNVTSSIGRIRSSLGSKEYIETVPGQGYRCTVDCNAESDGTSIITSPSPSESPLDFGALGTIHVHVDGIDAGDLVADLVNEFNVRDH